MALIDYNEIEGTTDESRNPGMTKTEEGLSLCTIINACRQNLHVITNLDANEVIAHSPNSGILRPGHRRFFQAARSLHGRIGNPVSLALEPETARSQAGAYLYEHQKEGGPGRDNVEDGGDRNHLHLGQRFCVSLAKRNP